MSDLPLLSESALSSIPSADLWQLLAVGLLVMCSAFFSGSETALFSLTDLRRLRLSQNKSFLAASLARIFEDPRRLLITILLMNTVVNVFASSLFDALLSRYFGAYSVLVSIALMTPLLVLVGEITPKLIAMNYAESLAPLVAPVLAFFSKVSWPLSLPLGILVGWVQRLFGGNLVEARYTLNEQELKQIVEIGSEEGLFEKGEATLVRRFLEFRELTVADIVVPRTQIDALEAESDYAGVLEHYREHRFSRIPVYREDLDDIVGVLYMKELLRLTPEQREQFTLAQHMKQPFFVPFSKKIRSLMREMQQRKVMMAFVLDEHGGVLGLVTLEDILEEIVGELYAEDDEDANYILKRRGDNTVIRADMPLEDFNEVFGMSIDSDEVLTIGGYLMHELGRLPEKEECIDEDGVRIIAARVEGSRLETLRIKGRRANLSKWRGAR